MVAGGLWIAALLLAGWLGEGCAEARIEDRLARSLQAEATVDSVELGLVRGHVLLRQLRLERDGTTGFRIDVHRVDADVAPLGLAALQDTAGDVAVRGVRVEASALGLLLREPSGRRPVRVDSLRLEDVRLSLDALRLLPGLAGVEVEVVRADVGPCTLRTPLSWVFALRRLTARLRLPAGIELGLEYAGGTLRLSGSLLGGTPLEVPFALPPLDPARELDQLAELGARLAAALAREVGARWLRGLPVP